MLSGCHPFDGETVNDLFKRIENLEFKYPSHFSKEVRALLDKIIVVDPHNRATIADIRYDPWFKINYHGTLDAMLSSVPNTSNDLVGESGVIVTLPNSANNNGTGASTTGGGQNDTSENNQTTNQDGENTQNNTETPVTLPTRIVVNNEDLENAVQDVDIDDGEERFVVQDPNQQRVPRGTRQNKVDPRRRLMAGGVNGSSTERMSIRMQNMEQLNAFELIAVMMRGKLNPLVSKHFTRRANRFSTCGHPDDLYDRMIQYLHEKKFIVRPKETEYEFKAIIKNKLHEMNFAVQFFIVSFEMIIVEVIRLKGNILKFQEIFREIQSLFDYEAQKKALMRPITNGNASISVTSSMESSSNK